MEKNNKVTEEPSTVSIAEHHIPLTIEKVTIEPTPVTTPPASTATPDAPPPRLNYLAANERRVQILADAKAIRVAAADEKAREKAALDEYALAIKLSAKYGFTAATPPVPSVPQAAPPVQQAQEKEGSSIVEPPPFRYFEKPPISIRYV
ncbi:hypothetical protein T492DRAFT_833818 [Pavlovales sp. CCMP2436]|nr:hypothetical protein T492DRAFT_833818 [Pavlovales sp. CCMP2436]